MKIYISADIEGTTGIANWDETEKTKGDYQKFAEQMTREVNAACEGALEAGAKEIWIKDAHDSGRNIDASKLPEEINLIRGWSGHPFSMVQELDETFDALLFTGYHSPGGSNSNPLSHTMSTSTVNYIKLNGELLSEFRLHSYIAAMLGVPVVFLSGDKGLCDEAKALNSNIKVVAVNKGVGGSTISISPNLSIKLIKQEVKNALMGDLEKCKIKLPEKFELELTFNQHTKAYRASFYPGMKLVSPKQTLMQTTDYYDVLRAILFLV